MMVMSVLRKPIHITEGKQTEKDTIRKLLMESYLQYEADFASERWERYYEELKTAVDNEYIDQLLVAKSKDTMLGTVQLFPNATVAYEEAPLIMNHPIIRFLAVHPDGRGLGIARKLLDYSTAYARSKDAAIISLHTTDIMKDAVKLYEKYGFQRNQAYDYIKSDVEIHCYSFQL